MDPAFWPIGGEFYGAKRCEPQWFDEETEDSDDVDVLTVRKFRGDLAYRRQEYQRALQEYSSISENLSSTHCAVTRDVREGQARCLAHLGRHTEALEIATDLENKATNATHLSTVLYLQFAICSSWPNLEKTIFCLQKLIVLHPFNPWAWAKLAEAYLSLRLALSESLMSTQGQSGLPSSDKTVKSAFPHSGQGCLLCFPGTLPESSVFSLDKRSSHGQTREKALESTPSCMAGSREAVFPGMLLKACASLIRARLLLQLTEAQQTSFALEKNERTQREIEDRMKGFHFPEDALLRIAETTLCACSSADSAGAVSTIGPQSAGAVDAQVRTSIGVHTGSFVCARSILCCWVGEHRAEWHSSSERSSCTIFILTAERLMCLLCFLVMGEDIVPEKMKEEVRAEVQGAGSAALAGLVAASVEGFEDKWFGKLGGHFCSLESPFHTEPQVLA
ncbi:hypothetical protein GW7_03580 [Heterocephalus glaber]|uniref:Zinc fingers and homeoboxes protein 1 n=1 Tax=Heterocephalus glaber TaxID=10181 RepID=G5AY85_HETGA|nr:hypothetical protein GW7_03580 [Heterocephalus glaber]